MLVKEIMTKSVVSIAPDDTIEKAAKLMKEYDVGSIPVCRGNEIVGIITDRDIIVRSTANGLKCNEKLVKDIMSSNPVLGNPDMDTNDATRIMSERQIRRLPIAENNNLIGMISLGDLAVEANLTNEVGSTLSDISEPCSPKVH
ncbi:CBS domain-containing protein [Clostridium grantii]|uniref:CBS domain-containing protein n=1 Tax=Clostridium grantii DSM 8605 TaxID=1121316 RepID=A0A1M5RSI8_9CLOT|nr:CBS domain-containing protein [Clostridium grantii]SHH29111.1 CBS domain-containing protein [Clostridium grantii DSM 8605]